MKILFILKYREVQDPNCGVYSYGGLSSGLFNSARMVSEMINQFGVRLHHAESKLVQVIDNNDIDREVAAYKPDVVIVEAFWVVPEKFEVLTKLHPRVKWLIRNHSNIPFLAQEGIAMDWISGYVKHKNVYLATNTKESLEDLREAVAEGLDIDVQDAAKKVLYFPNYYMTSVEDCWHHHHKDHIDIGCFGAIRPLKNHLLQAIAAIRFARQEGKKLRFHINSGRPESGGLPILHNLRGLFDGNVSSELIEHTWMPHAEFVKLIAKMDISTQVSFSETFNIVTADAVTMGVPVVVSPDVPWIGKKYQADPTSSKDMVEKLRIAYKESPRKQHHVNRASLETYNNNSYNAIGDCILYLLDHHDHGHFRNRPHFPAEKISKPVIEDDFAFKF